MVRTIASLVALTAAGLLLAAPAVAGGGGGGAVCPAFTEGSSTLVVLRDNCFGPVSAVAEAGTEITVRNLGQQPHTYTAADGSFDTGTIPPGRSVTVRLPDREGMVPVYCTLHADPAGNGMAGTIMLDLAAEPVAAVTASTASGSSGVALTVAVGFVVGFVTRGAFRRRGDHVRASQVLPA